MARPKWQAPPWFKRSKLACFRIWDKRFTCHRATLVQSLYPMGSRCTGLGLRPVKHKWILKIKKTYTTRREAREAPTKCLAFHLVLARNGASAPSTLDETLSRSNWSGEVIVGRAENCSSTRIHGKTIVIYSEVLHRVLYPNAHSKYIKVCGKRKQTIPTLPGHGNASTKHSGHWSPRAHEGVLFAPVPLARNGGDGHPAHRRLGAARIAQPSERIEHAAPRVALDALLEQTTCLLLHAVTAATTSARRELLRSRSRRCGEPDALRGRDEPSGRRGEDGGGDACRADVCEGGAEGHLYALRL